MYLWQGIGTIRGNASGISSSANPGRFREYNLNDVYVHRGCTEKVENVCLVWKKMNGGNKPTLRTGP